MEVFQKKKKSIHGVFQKTHVELNIIHVNTFFVFFWNNQWYLDLFKYLTILLDMYSPPIPHIPGYYKEESIKDGPNVLARGFKLRISWIS